MKNFNHFTYKEKQAFLVKAKQWYFDHTEHVNGLVAAHLGNKYPPPGSDCRHPELWKSAHWKWFLEGHYEYV